MFTEDAVKVHYILLCIKRYCVFDRNAYTYDIILINFEIYNLRTQYILQ